MKPLNPTKNFIKIITLFLKDKDKGYSGYDVASLTGLRCGAVYPLLHELQSRTLLKARWEEKMPDEQIGPPRKIYQITESGYKMSRDLLAQEYPFLKDALHYEEGNF